MARPIIPLRIEVLDAPSGQLELDRLCDAAMAEAALIAHDFGLDVEIRLEIEQLSGSGRRASGLMLYVDGLPSLVADKDVAGALHRRRADMATGDITDALWSSGGGVGAAPTAFHALVRDLLQHRIRPDRIAQTVARWKDADASSLFEDALSKVSRRIDVHVHPDRISDLGAAFAANESSSISLLIDGLFYELGIVLGEIETVADATLPLDIIRLRINDLRSAPLPLLAAGELVVNDTPDRLNLLNINGRNAVNPANGSECAIISDTHSDVAKQAGLTVWNVDEWACVGIAGEVRRAAAAVLTRDGVGSLVDRLGTAFPYLSGYVKERVGIESFAKLLRLLLAEEISIRNMRLIIDSLALRSPARSTPIDYSKFIIFAGTYSSIPSNSISIDASHEELQDMADRLRTSLKHYISHKYTRGGNTLVVYLLDPAIEQRLVDRRPLSLQEWGELIEAFDDDIGNLPPTAQPSCLLTTSDIRRRLLSEIGASYPHLSILSYQELSPDLNIQPIARISVENWQRTT